MRITRTLAGQIQYMLYLPEVDSRLGKWLLPATMIDRVSFPSKPKDERNHTI